MAEKTTTVKPKWYVGVKTGSTIYHCDIFKDHTIPTVKRYPQYGFCWGGYPTKRKALQVAMYHNYAIDTPEPFIPRGFKDE